MEASDPAKARLIYGGGRGKSTGYDAVRHGELGIDWGVEKSAKTGGVRR